MLKKAVEKGAGQARIFCFSGEERLFTPILLFSKIA
jgi:hypothetical protein